MEPKIEKLIDLALADGELTDKKRAVIFRKAEELNVDLDEVELVLEGRYHKLKAETSKPRKEKVGNLKTCPSCGASVQSFSLSCNACGHEFTSTASSDSLQKLFDQIDKIETEERGRKRNLWQSFDDSELDKAIANRKASTIDSFPIPNNREDLLEFFALAINGSKNSGGSQDPNNALLKAWRRKADKIKTKAETFLKDDPYAESLLSQYLTSKTFVLSRNQIQIFGSVFAMILVIGFIYFGIGSENEAKQAEIQRIENVEMRVNELIEEERYDQALIQLENINWTVRLGANSVQVEMYNNKRENIRDLILDLRESKE